MPCVKTCRIFFLAALIAVCAFRSSADPVTLMTNDAALTVKGEFLGYDGEFFRIKTEFGVLEADAAEMNCVGVACPDMTAHVSQFTLSGAPSMMNVLMPSLLESFAARNGLAAQRIAGNESRFDYELRTRATGDPVARVTFRPTSSEGGFADLIAREADIALSLRPATISEVALARIGDLGDLTSAGRARIIALDALVSLVSVTNPVSSIDMADLAAIFAGEITSWEPLGGAARPIALHMRDPASGLSHVFENRILREYGKNLLSKGITRHLTNADLARAVADDPLALGLGSYSDMKDAVPLAVIGPCQAASVASVTGVKTEDYPLTSPLFAYLPSYRLPRLARDFLRYVGSPGAQPVIRRAGFVDQFPAAIPLDSQGARLANAIEQAGADTDLTELKRLVKALRGRSRLTITFRFENGATTLDAQSSANV